MMRVSFILPAYFDFPVGGYRVVYEYANYLASEGHTASIIFPREIQNEARRSPSHWLKYVVWAGRTRLRHRPLVSWHSMHPGVRLTLASELNPQDIPDGEAVIATAWQTAGSVSKLPLSKGKKLYLLQDHEVWNGATDTEVNATFNLDFRVIAISEWLADLSRSHGARDVIVIPNGLDHNRFRVTVSPTLRSPSVLALYHHEARKGVAVALSALTKVHSVHPEVSVTMFGVSDRGEEVPLWIDYERRPSQERLVNLYNEHSIFLSSSVLEGWSLPAAEAMACGCVFVGTDSKGPREFSDDGVSALLCQPGDEESLFNNLCKVIEDKVLRLRLQSAGTAGMQRFTWERSGAALVEAISA